MPIVDSFGKQVAARLLDFFGSATPWHRALWCSSVCMALDEVVEASQAHRAGVLSEESLRNAMKAVMILAGPDPGVGPEQVKRSLQQSLAKPLVANGVEFS